MQLQYFDFSHNWICKVAAKELQTVNCKGFDHGNLTVKLFFFIWDVIFARDISSLVPGLGTIFSSPIHKKAAYMHYLDLDVHCPRQAVKFNHSLTPHKMTNSAVFLP